MRSITILGSTGSVGQSTIDLITRHPDRFRVEALVAGRNVDRLVEQALALRPVLAVIGDGALYETLSERLAGTGIAAGAGEAAILEAAARPADLVMAAIVGAAGLAPTLTAVRQGTTVAFANKECLVCAGPLMMAEIARHGAKLLPVDSEHNAIFQVFEQDQRHAIDQILLTASGGPFRTWTLNAMGDATPAQAVAHPKWSMGAKISVDSATMMNKGLEVIEASYLFDMPEPKIEVLIHPQSVVHSLVRYTDGSLLAQLGSPDMRTPIAYALGYPERIAAPTARLDLAELGRLEFEKPDDARFPALGLARAALQMGGAAPTILNAANEVAVAAFLSGRIGFLEIARAVERCLDKFPVTAVDRLEDVFAIDAEARAMTEEWIADAAVLHGVRVGA